MLIQMVYVVTTGLHQVNLIFSDWKNRRYDKKCVRIE